MDEQILIEQYLDDSLSKEEYIAVEERIKNDPAFAKEVAIWQVIVNNIEPVVDNNSIAIDHAVVEEGLNALQAKLRKRDFYNTPKKNISTKYMFWFLGTAVAASIIVLIAYNLFVPKQNSYDVLEQSVLLDLAMRSEQDSPLIINIKRTLFNAFILYNDAEYKMAIPLFKEVIELSKDTSLDSLSSNYYQTRTVVYLANAYLAEQEPSFAIKCLKPLSVNDKTREDVQREVFWYLAMAYIDNHQEEQALYLLRELKGDSLYNIKAQQWIGELSSIKQ